MATITGLTAARMQEIEAASIVDGDVVGDDLILTTKGGSQINAGNVRGPEGDPGPVGSDLAVVTAKQLFDVGISGQIRAGRQLAATDFTNMGLSTPIGLWNLSNLNDSSGNGRNLSNKGGVLFASGIDGIASSAAQFAGSTAQGLYINDAGAADPFRIRTGSFGCWFRTAKKGTYQALMGKYPPADGNYSYWLQVLTTNNIEFGISSAGTWGTANASVQGLIDVTDDRWHFVVAVCDGAMMYVYLDGVLEKSTTCMGPIFPGNPPFTIGALQANASNPAHSPWWGRMDEAFITADILSEDQARNLYCVKIPHTLSVIPKNVGLNVRRRKKGAALAAGDFPTQPLRLHNFSAGSLNDEGSHGQVLVNNGGAVSVAGVDGSPGNAFSFIAASGQNLSATDAGLPSALATRSFGCWIKSHSLLGTTAFLAYGSISNAREILYLSAGAVVSGTGVGGGITGPFVADGQWHFIVAVQDNGAIDGLKHKFYVDGKMIGSGTTFGSVTLVGANAFRIGADVNGTAPFQGLVDAAFVCNYALTPEQIVALYVKGALALGVSPKNSGDHVELMTSTDLFCIFDTLEAQHQIDLVVA